MGTFPIGAEDVPASSSRWFNFVSGNTIPGIVLTTPFVLLFYHSNLLLNERVGRSGEYWPEAVAIRTSLRSALTKTIEGQYSPVRLELARLVSSLLYGTRAMLGLIFPAFTKAKHTQLMTVSTETIRMAKSQPKKDQSERSDLACHIINRYNYFHFIQLGHLPTLYHATYLACDLSVFLVALEVNSIFRVLQIVLGNPMKICSAMSSLSSCTCHFSVKTTKIHLKPRIGITSARPPTSCTTFIVQSSQERGMVCT